MSEYVGSRVAIPGTRGYGILRYFGPIDGKQGTFAGIELTGPIAASRGKNNGAVNGVQYFDVVQPMSGLFLPIDRLKQANPHIGSANGGTTSANAGSSAYNKQRLSADSITQSPSSSDHIFYTPSPSNRSLNSHRISSGTLSSMSRNGTSNSPPSYSQQSTQQINITKRDSKSAGNKNNLINNDRISSVNSPPPPSLQAGLPHHASLPSSENNSSNFLPLSNTISADTVQAANNSPRYSRSSSSADDQAGLQKQYNDLKQKYDFNEREMAEKIEVLNELRLTVDDLQPLLEEYEIDLAEKDKKLLRQRADFEHAREEWRSSLELLVNTHEEAEVVYDQKFRELHEQIEILVRERELLLNKDQTDKPIGQLPASTFSDQPIDKTGEVERLNLQIRDLQSENTLLQKSSQAKIQSLEFQIRDFQERLSKSGSDETEESAKVADAQHGSRSALSNDEEPDRIAELEHDISMLKQDKSSLEFTLGELQRKLKQKDTQVAELEIKLDDISNNDKENITELSQNLASVNLNDAKLADAELVKLQRLVDDLRHQLEIRPTFEELSELQKSLDELDTLHEDELGDKVSLINTLTSENASLKHELTQLRTENQDLAQKCQAHDSQQQSQHQQHQYEQLSPPPQQEQQHQSPQPQHPQPQQQPQQQQILKEHDLEPSPYEDTANTLEARAEGELPIYKPASPIDPSAGKDDWCGLCERDGHSSINCPYENDIF